MYEPFTNQCVSRPQYALLKRAYTDYRTNGHPCQRGATNQCAVRMSIALGRAGFGLEGYQPQARLHNGAGRCRTDGMPHLMAAREVADWLRRTLGQPVGFRPQAGSTGCEHAHATMRGQTGIVYFNNCFIRAGAATQSGDHIDLFDGHRIYNDINNTRAGGDETRHGPLFGRADEVWFWPLA